MPSRRLDLRAWMVSIMFGLAILAASHGDRHDSLTRPEPQVGEERWWILHRSHQNIARTRRVDLVFLGDSITEGWDNNATWQRYYRPRHAANLGIGGDRIQHVLWRIDHGAIDGISPEVVVLLLGTNNLGPSAANEVADGVAAVVARLRQRLPETRILLLGLLPRVAFRTPEFVGSHEVARCDPRVNQVNARLARLDDGRMIFYLDVGPALLDQSGMIPKRLMPDFLHLSEAGYRHWAEAMEPTLFSLLHPADAALSRG